MISSIQTNSYNNLGKLELAKDKSTKIAVSGADNPPKNMADTLSNKIIKELLDSGVVYGSSQKSSINEVSSVDILLPIKPELYVNFDPSTVRKNLNKLFDNYIDERNKNSVGGVKIDENTPLKELKKVFDEFMADTPLNSIVGDLKPNILAQNNSELKEWIAQNTPNMWSKELNQEWLKLMLDESDIGSFKSKWLNLVEKNRAEMDKLNEDLTKAMKDGLERDISNAEKEMIKKQIEPKSGDGDKKPFKPIEGKSHNSASANDIAKQFFEDFIKAQSENGVDILELLRANKIDINGINIRV